MCYASPLDLSIIQHGERANLRQLDILMGFLCTLPQTLLSDTRFIMINLLSDSARWIECGSQSLSLFLQQPEGIGRLDIV